MFGSTSCHTPCTEVLQTSAHNTFLEAAITFADMIKTQELFIIESHYRTLAHMRLDDEELFDQSLYFDTPCRQALGECVAEIRRRVMLRSGTCH